MSIKLLGWALVLALYVTVLSWLLEDQGTCTCTDCGARFPQGRHKCPQTGRTKVCR